MLYHASRVLYQLNFGQKKNMCHTRDFSNVQITPTRETFLGLVGVAKTPHPHLLARCVDSYGSYAYSRYALSASTFL